MSAVQKKVLKKRQTEVAQVVEPVAAPVATPVSAPETHESTIPSSRVSNYVSGVKLNKEFDDQIEKVKAEGWQSVPLSDEDKAAVEAKVAGAVDKNKAIQAQLDDITAGKDIGTILSDDDKIKVGEAIKSLEEKGSSPIDIREISKNLLSKRMVTHDTATIDVISKKRSKFSKDSFNVLASFGDILVNEITKYTFERLAEVGNSTIEPKYVFSSKISEGPLYGYYSQLPAFKEAAAAAAEPSKKKSKREEVTEQEPEEQTEAQPQSDDKEINFKFYVKSIVYQQKKTNETYANAKVSERYQKFCSDIVLNMLDDMVDLSQIILQVMSTKTISAKLFKAAIFTKTYNLEGHDAVVKSLD